MRRRQGDGGPHREDLKYADSLVLVFSSLALAGQSLKQLPPPGTGYVAGPVFLGRVRGPVGGLAGSGCPDAP